METGEDEFNQAIRPKLTTSHVSVVVSHRVTMRSDSLPPGINLQLRVDTV